VFIAGATDVAAAAGGHGKLGTRLGDSLVAFMLPQERVARLYHRRLSRARRQRRPVVLPDEPVWHTLASEPLARGPRHIKETVGGTDPDA
jgi:hypothetical protein